MFSRPTSQLAVAVARLRTPRTAVRAAALLRLATPGARSPAASPSFSTTARRLVDAPRVGDGPLMERRSDRALPDVLRTQFRWSRTLPWFVLIVAGSSVAIFNYQKSSSPVVSSTLYALRTSPRARAYLGDEIYFQDRIPWVAGEMNPMQGRIDVHFMVKGTRHAARMRFTSRRPTARGVFETVEWSLETADGHKIDLLQDVGEGQDPFRGIQLLPDDYVDVAEELGWAAAGSSGHDKAAAAAAAASTTASKSDEIRGFRQALKK